MLSLFAGLALLCAAPAFAAQGTMTKAERDYLVSQLETSKAGVLAAIQGLTPEQWTFKPAPEVWSVQECAEHIILAEDLIFAGEQRALETPPSARLASATPEGDRALVAEVEDRSAKAKAPAALVPSGKFPTPASAAAEFIRRREKTIAYAKTTDAPLRIHSGIGPAGSPADAYQFLIMLAAHSVRHTEQIREVEANPAYPRAH